MNEKGDVRDFHVVAEFEIGCVHECLSHGLFPPKYTAFVRIHSQAQGEKIKTYDITPSLE